MIASAEMPSGPALKRRIMEFVDAASMEITSHDAKLVPALAQRLPAGSRVYVAHTPRATLQDIVDTALRVEQAGLRASPHIAARRIGSAEALERAALELVAGGIDRALVIAGDADRPAGPYPSTLDVLQSGILTSAGLSHVAVAAHPEGHRAIGPARLWDALKRKQAWAARARVGLGIVTQFGFDAAAICDWYRHLTDHGIQLPIHVGMAGPAPLPKLITYAMQCGVGASLRGLMRNMSAMRNVTGLATTPGEMVAKLVTGCATPDSRIVGPHFFSFGGAMATADWLRTVREGRFELANDGLPWVQSAS